MPRDDRGGFLSLDQPVINTIRCHRHESGSYGIFAVIDFSFGPYDARRASLHVQNAGLARELLAAAYEALTIHDPDAAPDALLGLINSPSANRIGEPAPHLAQPSGQAHPPCPSPACTPATPATGI